MTDTGPTDDWVAIPPDALKDLPLQIDGADVQGFAFDAFQKVTPGGELLLKIVPGGVASAGVPGTPGSAHSFSWGQKGP